MIASVLDVLAANRIAWRRARNLRAGRARAPVRVAVRMPAAPRWIALGGLVLALLGAIVIRQHVRMLDAVAGAQQRQPELDALRRVLPGAGFDVPRDPGATLGSVEGGALLILSGMRAQGAVRIDLCSQMLDPAQPRLLPLKIGLPFAEAARMARNNAAAGSPATLRNIVTAEPGSALPRIEISGTAVRDFAEPSSQPLVLRWSGGTTQTRWISDATGGQVVAGPRGDTAVRREGWLLAGEGEGLHILRRANLACPQAGELLLQRYRAGGDGPALVAAFPTVGEPASARLAPGRYDIPAAAQSAQEDRELFDALRAHGLLRLDAGGFAELAPPDLAAWRAAPVHLRAATLAGWDGPPLDSDTRRFLDRLYQKADGEFLREQVRVFNSERRLLAWRLRTPLPDAGAAATSAGAPVTITTSMPAGAARLFDRIPTGWGPWSRAAGASSVTIDLRPASSTMEMLVAGRVTAVRGARILQREDVCSGRACPRADAVQRLVLAPDAVARRIALGLQAIDAAGLTDPRYRYLGLSGGELAWHTPVQPALQVRTAAAQVTLADRDGAPLWGAGRPSDAARAAGLAPLLGYRIDQQNSVAGMLARLPSATGQHTARLTLDLPLQAAAQSALECVGMRRGSWNGRACSGGSAPPAGRQAGLVVIDTETGDILAAAGAGMPAVDQRNWNEVRDFDAADPAASPLRLPAWQHDGGRDRSPGSTFKIISALGLEQAARHDAQLDALLGGVPLDTLDGIARTRGFGFRADVAVYPVEPRRAHVTNYHEQSPGRRAQEGKLGLEQALAYSLNTWFAWTAELSDRTLLGAPSGGVPDLQSLDPDGLREARPILDMAQRLGFGQPLRLDGGLLPAGYRWSPWDALQATPAAIDPIHSRHELRQMAIGLRMQATPLQMALAAAAVGQGRVVAPRLLAELDGARANAAGGPALGVRLDRIRAGMKGVIDRGTAASVFRGARFDRARPSLYGKTGTAPTGEEDAAGHQLATVWFAGWLEPGAVPGQKHRLAFAAFVSRSEATGGEHAAPVVAAVLGAMPGVSLAH